MMIMELVLQNMADNEWHRPDGVRRQLLNIITREESVVPLLKFIKLFLKSLAHVIMSWSHVLLNLQAE
jgi:hypothetical protein